MTDLAKKPVYLNAVMIGEAATWGQVKTLLAEKGTRLTHDLDEKYENRGGFFITDLEKSKDARTP